jgi:hypothetical protein
MFRDLLRGGGIDAPALDWKMMQHGKTRPLTFTDVYYDRLRLTAHH